VYYVYICSRRRLLIRAGISVTVPYIYSNRINCTIESKENRGEGNCDKRVTETRVHSGLTQTKNANCSLRTHSFYFTMAQQPPVDQGLLIIEDSWSQSDTHTLTHTLTHTHTQTHTHTLSNTQSHTQYHTHTLSHTHTHSVGFLWRSDQPYAQTPTW